jgi:S1-C subfamily serine protease
LGGSKAFCAETWASIDQEMKQQICRVNIGMKLRLKTGQWLYIADLSPKAHLPVFSSAPDDKGFRIVGSGSAFPVKRLGNGDTIFLTSKHVVESADELVKECERFMAALCMQAEQSSGKAGSAARYQQLLSFVNLSTKKDMTPDERILYQTTVDQIWDTYEKYLSMRADPGRVLFNKYAGENGVISSISLFLHRPGPALDKALPAKIVKTSPANSDSDLALLAVPTKLIPTLQFDRIATTEGEEIQVVGYPAPSDQIDRAGGFIAPTFSTGHISRVTPEILQVEAAIAKGNSGGPVISRRGRVLGVVCVRATKDDGAALPEYGGATPLNVIRQFAPELFQQQR